MNSEIDYLTMFVMIFNLFFIGLIIYGIIKGILVISKMSKRVQQNTEDITEIFKILKNEKNTKK
jgi:hypothetical protein